MPLKPAGSNPVETKADVPAPHVKQYAEMKDARILYQGLTQAALTSMAMGQFAPDLATHLVNVKAAVDELAAFIIERAK